MKSSLLIFLLFTFLYSNATAKLIGNSPLDSLFDSYFIFLEQQLNKKEHSGTEANFSGYAIKNLEKITGIRSEVPKGEYTFFMYTLKDLDMWKNWYFKNKKHLRLDRKNNEIFLNDKLIAKIEAYVD